ncbi:MULTISPECIES: DsbA family protein [unclassified Bradyrhizobium]|uniref:DsbA family protein n=1 Tax=unclassified Bradyrhizobium TaxID=2631580 RepID=UPI0028EA209A|nr:MULTISPECIES: DsbA family protein [unclassified Bradyrhizobium]
MRQVSDRIVPATSRRSVLALLAAGTFTLPFRPRIAMAQDADEPDEASVLRDPEAPVVGNPDGDIAIVEWFDYNCPYCRKLEPELQQVVHDDGKVRWVLKEWPILGPASVAAARMALACKYQDKYVQAHDALIGTNSKLTESRIDEILAGAGIDIDRAKRDLADKAKAIDAMLARNDAQARGLRFRGTPSFIVGKFRVPGVLTMAQFEQVIADARQAKGAK